MTGCEKEQRENLTLRKLIEGHKESMDKMQQTLNENGVKLDKINGTVKRHRLKHFPDVFRRIRSLEDIDKIEEGIEIGKSKMSAATKNTIAIVGCILTCFVVGSTIFLSAQKKLNKSVVKEMNAGMSDRYKASGALSDLKIIMQRIENLEEGGGEDKK